MSETMTVYFSSRTGHVLGAVTRAAGVVPAVPRAASQEDVLVQGPFEGTALDPTFPGFLVSSSDLSTLTLAPDLTLVLDPLSFQILALTDAAQRLALKVDEVSIRFISVTGSTEITVKVKNRVAQDESVWILIIGAALIEPRIAVGIIKSGEQGTTLTVPVLPNGDYHFLALIREHLPFAVKLKS